MSLDFSKIKLVIWDLDETFWKGVLSEDSQQFIPENIQLIKDMADAGVISSICTKNDYQKVFSTMNNLKIWDLFVFSSINWSSKGERVKQIIDEMNLRPVNVLFIDDNTTNLAEVENSCQGIMTENIDILPDLQNYFSSAPKKDLQHKRLDSYKTLEKKRDFKATVGSNEDFLKKCNIKVNFKKDCLENIERIHELILRSNQLNFTKVRSSIEELEETIKNPDIDCGYVTVLDDFGDYGIVGFYAVKDNTLLHFTFSCRTLNMGVEQYVYRKLGNPKVEIVGDVSSSLDTPNPDWINLEIKSSSIGKKNVGKTKILIKGPCDLLQIFSFIRASSNIVTEFSFVNNNGVYVEHGNHTLSAKNYLTLSSETKNRLINSLPFGDPKMFETQMFDPEFDFIVFSLFSDPNLGIYREKSSGAAVPFGEYTNDLTDESRWDEYIKSEVFVADCKFNKENLSSIKENFTFEGRLSPEKILENIKFLYEHIGKDTKLILNIGSDIPYEANNQPAYEGRHIFNAELKKLVKEFADNNNRVFLLDVSKYITGQECFTNNINHLTKPVYHALSEDLVNIINSNSDSDFKNNSPIEHLWFEFKHKVKINLDKFKKL